MIDFSTIQYFSKTWNVKDSEFSIIKDKLSYSILKYVEEENESEINKGNYDCFVSIKAIINVISSSYSKECNSIKLFFNDNTDSNEVLVWVLTQIIEEMVGKGQLLYIYDCQRVRSRIAEIVRYFSYLKQRFESDYENSPGLTHMVKLDIKTRYRPKRSFPLDIVLREVAACKNEISLDPNIKLVLQKRLDLSFSHFRKMVEYNFNTKNVKLSRFQSEGFKELFSASISKSFLSTDKSFIIQSNTGSGKTEAFLFPILLYTLLTYDQKGTKALLIYPRIDLCNDQLQRLIRYVWIINKTGALESKKIRISLQHGGFDKISFSCPHHGCQGTIRFVDENLVCDCNNEHIIDFITKKHQGNSDIIITTPDSLHRRLMDAHGKRNIWDNKKLLPKFVVLDEAHIYSDQMGMHVSNIIRRLRQKIKVKGKCEPIFIASSATVGDPEGFAKSLFSTDSAHVISPNEEDLEDLGREYIIFVKATNPRKVLVSNSEEKNQRYSVATNLSAMIQIAFCFYHTMQKNDGKDKIIGFVDSIDVIKRLGEKLCDAERNKELYKLRMPDSKLNTQFNLKCPNISCNNLPPNPLINRCKAYEDGECWWTMGEHDQDSMNIYIHKSGISMNCSNKNVDDDEWDLMITTSALEVGFDHPDVIGTFQYMAPMNIPGFVQRIGRGGRSPNDMPIAVVVLGSRPLDSFYFHHNSMLTYPSEDKLRIPIDPENQYIKTMHITSFIYDFISTYGTDVDVDLCYKQLKTKETEKFLNERKNQLIDEIITTFAISSEVAKMHLQKVNEYLDSCSDLLEPMREDSLFIDNIRYDSKGKSPEEIIIYLSQVIARIQMEDKYGA